MVPPAGKGGGGEGRGGEERRRERRGERRGGGRGEGSRERGGEEREGRGGEEGKGKGRRERGGEEREAKERIKRANTAGNLKGRSGACVCIFQYVPFQGDLFSIHRLQEVDDFSTGLLQGTLVLRVVLNQLCQGCKGLPTVQVIKFISALYADVYNFTPSSVEIRAGVGRDEKSGMMYTEGLIGLGL